MGSHQKDRAAVVDESYFTLTNSKTNGNDNYYSSNVELTPNEVKLKKRQL